ncbi:MAG: hypothetical protein AAFQ87_14690, partial [Bacteroidota bacterium]
MKHILLIIILLGTLSGNAQIRFSFGSSVATGLSSYAPTLSFVSPGQSSEVGFFGEYAWQEWYYIRIGLSFSAPQLRRPHFSRRFAYLGVPISVGLTPRGQDAIGPLFQTRYQAAFHLGGSDRLWSDLFRGTAAEFIDAKLTERSRRHRKQGGQRYMVEPNVKEGKGGL